MPIDVVQIPWDSGHRGQRMGAGPLHLVERGLLDCLDSAACVITLEPQGEPPTEIGTAFELHHALSYTVADAVRAGRLPLILSGNCNSAIGTISGLQAAAPDEPVGVLWFDGHGDSNTPETFTGTFLDAMGLSTLTGRCWQALCATIPGFSPVPDASVVLVGGHGMDNGARSVLAASEIKTITPEALRTGHELPAALASMRARGVSRLYVHLDVDVIDATYAPANAFAPAGGLQPAEVFQAVDLVARDLRIAAACVASYDPAFDQNDRVLAAAHGFLSLIAAAHISSVQETRTLS
jgi:arginase